MAYRVYLDPGHGGNDSGAYDGTNAASGDYLTSKESVLALDLAQRVQIALKRCGFEVRMSRSTNVYPSLTSRYTDANNWGAQAFVSIHFNAAGASARGIEVLYPRGITGRVAKSKALAQHIYNIVAGCTPYPDRKVFQDYRGLAVLNGTKMPACIFEYGFITNVGEEKLIHTEAYKKCSSEGTAKGICNYFGVKYVHPGGIVPTPSPTPAPTTYPVLYAGSKGAAVKDLQKKLNKLGAKLTVDGSYGPATKAAVMAFQKKHGLAVDGVVGSRTWNKLNELSSKVVTPAPKPKKPSAPPVNKCHVVSSMPTLRRGSSSRFVKHLQVDINRHKARLDKLLSVDGSFGPTTEAFVRRFQKRKGLQSDGVVGPRTWNKLL